MASILATPELTLHVERRAQLYIRKLPQGGMWADPPSLGLMYILIHCMVSAIWANPGGKMRVFRDRPHTG